MSKGSDTHVQELLPEIRAMVELGRSQREIAESCGFKDQKGVRELVTRARWKCTPQEGRKEYRAYFMGMGRFGRKPIK